MGKKDHSATAENIRVLVRCRPLSQKETAGGHKSCVEMDLAQNTVTVRNIIGEPDRWTFDAVINNTFSQKDIFTQFIMPLTESVLGGFNATVFAYGQSGSGKTHTMTGVMGDAESEGVIPRCVEHIFSSVKKMKEENPGFTVSMYVSFMELYNGKVRDLLAKQQVSLDIRESKDHTFFVQGAVVSQVKFPEDVMRHMEEGTDRRRTASTELNADSSRSHSIFSLILECTQTLEDGSTRAVSSKLNLVDLAGSERQGKTGASGDTLKEGCNINLSLSALGTVIDTIVKGGAHVPFRSSPLTMLLKDSLGGNSKTVMFANINPSERNLSETVSTLRFADRAKQIKNKPVVNMDSKDQKIAELTELVTELRGKLAKYENEGTVSLEKDVAQLQEKVGDLEVQLDNATKSREADLLDYEATKITLATERQTSSTRLVAMEDELNQLQNQLQIAESSGVSLQSQLNEVWAQCYSYFVSPDEKKAKPLEQYQASASLDEILQKAKKKLESGGEAALLDKIRSLTAELQASQAEHKATRKELKSTKAQLERQLAEVREELVKSLAKLEELKNTPPPTVEKDEKATQATSETTPVALQEAQAEYATQQEQLLSAMKLDDNGAAAMRLLREENEKMRQQLIAALAAMSSAGGVGTDAAMPSIGTAAATAAAVTPSAGGAGTDAAMPSIGTAAATAAAVTPSAGGAGTDAAMPSIGTAAATAAAVAPSAGGAGTDAALPSIGTAAATAAAVAPSAGKAVEALPVLRSPSPSPSPSMNSPAMPTRLPLVDAAAHAAVVNALKEELQEAKAKIDHITTTRDSLYAELDTQREELARAESAIAQHDCQLVKIQQEYEAKQAKAVETEEEARRLQSILHERSEQLEQLRTLLEKQKAIIVKNNEKAEYFQAALREKSEALVTMEQQFRAQLENRDAQMQQLINKRVTEFSEQRSVELDQMMQKQKKLKKKIQKLQEEQGTWEIQYDTKVCECEDLRNALEENKLEQIRMMRRMEYTEEGAELLEQKEIIQNSLDRVKQERKRKVDLFSMGEVQNAKKMARRSANSYSDESEYY